MVWLRASAQAEAFPTGYSTLDSATGGFMRGAVAVTAGWPGGGKTNFAINLAMRMGRRGAGGQGGRYGGGSRLDRKAGIGNNIPNRQLRTAGKT